MYKILYNLIEVDKVKFINFVFEQCICRIYNFKYFIEYLNKDVYRFLFYFRIIREWNKFLWDVVNVSLLFDFKVKFK